MLVILVGEEMKTGRSSELTGQPAWRPQQVRGQEEILSYYFKNMNGKRKKKIRSLRNHTQGCPLAFYTHVHALPCTCVHGPMYLLIQVHTCTHMLGDGDWKVIVLFILSILEYVWKFLLYSVERSSGAGGIWRAGYRRTLR